MRLFKCIDLWMQVSLITACIITSLMEPAFFLFSYFIVGGWQIFSCIVHYFSSGRFIPVAQRRRYIRLIGWLCIAGILLTPVILYFLFALLFISPFLAIVYVFICYQEMRLLNHRMLIHLK